MADPLNAVLPFGTRIRITNIDPYGFLGRDFHPEATDIGWSGVVVENHLGDMQGGSVHNAAPGTAISQDEELCAYVCYLAIDEAGRKLQVINYELEVLT